MFRVPALTLVGTALITAGAGAQAVADPGTEGRGRPAIRRPAATGTPASLPIGAALEPTLVPAPPVPPAPQAEERGPLIQLSWRGVAETLGGALVGGWVGYVSAQVAHGDWDKASNSALKRQRSLWTAAGAVLGVVGSRVVGATGSPSAGLRSPVQYDHERTRLSTEEIRSSKSETAFALISTLRPEWLVTRGTNSPTETTHGSLGNGGQQYVLAGAEKIAVYMNDIELGGVAKLRDISTDLLTGARFLSAREATYRYGMGHAYGVILLQTGSSAP